ncbi:class B sortase [Butyrivibrio sp. NC3005]|uniref:class B sortase n=1 Tax=Butyrivibrio sp. NC3005 TaxID=1280685 RepID=UPI000414E402|nr:class B sortase [Butyrivibrio sp. NC3005]
MKKASGKSGVTAGRVISSIIVLFLLGVICYELYQIAIELKERQEAVSLYESLQEKCVKVNKNKLNSIVKKTETDDEIQSKEVMLDVNHVQLSEANKDYVGWLYWNFDVEDNSKDFTISYPIVKENYVNEYLYTTFEKTSNSAGCIFMDVDSDAKFKGYSDFLFGHNMKNGTMFGSIDNIYRTKDSDILKTTPQFVYVYTKEKILKYVVYGYEFTTTADENAYSYVKSTDEYDAYVNRMQKHSGYKTPMYVDFYKRPEILNLSTCSGASGTDKRFIVHCVLVSE